MTMSDMTFFDLDNREICLSLDDILFFQNDHNEITAYLTDGKQIVFQYYVSALECALPLYFIRISDDIIVHRLHISEALEYNLTNIIIVMNDVNKTSFIVSPHYEENVRLNKGFSHKPSPPGA
jgi:DNA-binding LytR/AlgR family response regulator